MADLNNRAVNIAAGDGKAQPFDHWLQVVYESKLNHHEDVLAFLTSEHGLSHEDAERVTQEAFAPGNRSEGRTTR